MRLPGFLRGLLGSQADGGLRAAGFGDFGFCQNEAEFAELVVNC
jgi:hypothetical protein